MTHECSRHNFNMSKKGKVVLSFLEFKSVIPVIEPEIITSAIANTEGTSEEALRARRLKSLNQRNQRQGHRKQLTYKKTLTYSGVA